MRDGGEDIARALSAPARSNDTAASVDGSADSVNTGALGTQNREAARIRVPSCKVRQAAITSRHFAASSGRLFKLFGSTECARRS